MPPYKAASKRAGSPAPRRQLASKAARKSVPRPIYAISSDSGHSEPEVDAPATSDVMPRTEIARHRMPYSRVAGPPAPKRLLFHTKVARKSAPSVRYPSSSNADSSDDADGEETGSSGANDTYFCRDNAVKKARSKRRRDPETGPSNDAKRQKTCSVHQGTDAHGVHPGTEDLLEHATLEGLKLVLRTALKDEGMRPRLQELLKSKSGDILERRRRATEEACAAILSEAEESIEKLEAWATELKGMESSSAWGNTLSDYLPRVKSLLDRGPLVRGPQEAWLGLMGIARLSMPNWEAGPRVQEGENANDDFHDEVDEHLLLICKAMKEHQELDWLRDERIEELWQLQERPSGPCTYRYQRTLGFLEQFKAS